MYPIISSSIFAASTLIPQIAAAAADGDPRASENLTSTAMSMLPLVIFIGLLVFLFRRQTKSPLAKLQMQYMEDQLTHTRRIELLLERIAVALEKK